MGDRRIRLTDDDIALIVSALRARAAMTSGARAHRIRRLAERLGEGGIGNPQWRLGSDSQAHETQATADGWEPAARDIAEGVLSDAS